ncbi:RNA-directed DNA polymerase, eukaryota [Tanacetum coccineum]
MESGAHMSGSQEPRCLRLCLLSLASQAWMEWLMKKKKAFDQRGDMAIAAWGRTTTVSRTTLSSSMPSFVGDQPLKMRFPRVFTVELNRNISVAQKKEQRSNATSFRRAPRSGIEATQWEEIKQIIDSVCLTPMEDRWIWSVNGSGLFSVASTRTMIDKLLSSSGGDSTKWCKLLPIKVNIMVWKLSLDRLPTRLNLSSRGINIPNLQCPICEDHLDSRDHLFFSCMFVNSIIDRFARWWEIQNPHMLTFQHWMDWFSSLHLNSKKRVYLQATFFSLW